MTDEVDPVPSHEPRRPGRMASPDELDLDLSERAASSEDWEWAHHVDDTEAPAIPAANVLAVLVCHRAGDWLPRTLRALAQLTTRPGRLLAVHVGPDTADDPTGTLLADAVTEGIVDQVVTADPHGFGQAVAAAVAADEGLTADGEPEGEQWLWLLHDDLEPQPESLQALLQRAAAEPSPDLLFPKLVGPRRRNHPDRLLEIGQSITPTGARALSVEPGDIDQLQQDSTATLGGSSAGLLVRRSAWDQLGGFDPDLPLFHDAVDLGWRANDAGLAVHTAPAAALHHHQRGRWGDRHSPIAVSLPALDRLTAARLIAARSAHPTLTRLRLWITALVQSLVLVIGKNPLAARSSWTAGWQILADGAAVSRVRARVIAGPNTDQAALRPTRAGRVAQLSSVVAGSFTDRYNELRDDSDTSLDDLIGDDYTGGRSRGQLIAPLTATVVTVVLLCLLAGRRLFGPGQLTSLHLAPAPNSLAEAFSAWLNPAAGHSGPNAPWLGVAAVASAITGGQPELWARIVVIGAPLWAALAMVVLARAMLGRAVVQRTIAGHQGPTSVVVALAALAWGMLVAALGLSQRGSVSAIAVAVLAPLAIAATLSWFAQDTEDSQLDTPAGERWRAPGLVALWLGLLGTAQPLFWLVAMALAATHLLIGRRFSARTLVVGLGPLLLSGPWLVRLIHQPARLLTDADPTVVNPDFAPRPLAMALGRLGQGDAPTLFATVAIGVLWLLAAATAVRGLRDGRATGTALLATALAAILIGSVISRVVLTIDGSPVRASVDSWVTVAVLALVGSALWGLSTIPAGWWRRATVAAVLVSTLAAGSGWQWAATAGPVSVSAGQLPAYVVAVQNSPQAGRALMIDVSPQGTGWTLTSATTPQWGTGELPPAGGNRAWAAVLNPLVVQIASANPPVDLAQRLTALGISHVWLSQGTPNQVNGLTNTAGLVAARADAGTVVFTVSGLVSRAALAPSTGQRQPLVQGRVARGTTAPIVIAEPADPRWRVSVGGTELPIAASSQPIGLRVSPGTASGVLHYATAPSVWAAIWEGAVLLILLVLAAPTLGRPRLTGDGARFEETR